MSAETVVAEPVAAKKVSKSETGNAKNAANFAELIIAIQSFGTAYNPSSESLTIPNLEALRNNANSALVALQKADSIYRDTVEKRQLAFEKMSFLTTRITGALNASGIDDKVKEEIASHTRKIKGVRASKEKDENGRSVSQMGFDNRIHNFRQLAIRVAGIPEYKPNESDITLESLNLYIDTLSSITSDVQRAQTEVDKARRERDRIMYAERTGLVDVAYRVKEYVKSVFSSKSKEYRAISGMAFKNN
jgi:hypothetical protein